MDHQQVPGGYGGPSQRYGGRGPQHRPYHTYHNSVGGSSAGFAPPVTHYNTVGNAGATAVPNFGGGASDSIGQYTDSSHMMGGPSGTPVNYGGTGSPGSSGQYNMPSQMHQQQQQQQQQPMNNKAAATEAKESSKKKEDEADMFEVLFSGISRKFKACLVSNCAEDSDNEDDGRDFTQSYSGLSGDAPNRTGDRSLVHNQTDPYGNVYSGQILEGKRDGMGTILYAASGDRYEGTWEADQPHGEGKVIRGDGNGMFEGRWHQGTLQMVKNGYASVKDAEGNFFEGSFVNWNKHGKGKLQSANGETYNGEWANGMRQGYGILTRPDGSRFEGVFDNNEPTNQGEHYGPAKKSLPNNEDRPISPMRHGGDGMRSRDSDEEEDIPQASPHPQDTLTSFNAASNEFDRMVATDNFAPTKFKSKEEKKAAKKLVQEKKKLDKAHVEQEQRKKKQVEALLKAEVKQKRMLSAKMKREQKRLDERQKIQAKALTQAKKEQEKYLSDLDKQHQELVKEKMKEIERLQLEAVKRTEADKKRVQKEIEAERVRLQRFEASQRASLQKQAKELEMAQRKFAAEQARAMTEQQKREHMLKLNADQQKAAMARKAEMDAFRSKHKPIAKNNRALKKNLHGYAMQVKKNEEMTMQVEDLKKKSSLFRFKKQMKQGGRNDNGGRGENASVKKGYTTGTTRGSNGRQSGHHQAMREALQTSAYGGGNNDYYGVSGYDYYGDGAVAYDYRDEGGADYGGVGSGYAGEPTRMLSEETSFDI